MFPRKLFELFEFQFWVFVCWSILHLDNNNCDHWLNAFSVGKSQEIQLKLKEPLKFERLSLNAKMVTPSFSCYFRSNWDRAKKQSLHHRAGKIGPKAKLLPIAIPTMKSASTFFSRILSFSFPKHKSNDGFFLGFDNTVP